VRWGRLTLLSMEENKRSRDSAEAKLRPANRPNCQLPAACLVSPMCKRESVPPGFLNVTSVLTQRKEHPGHSRLGACEHDHTPRSRSQPATQPSEPRARASRTNRSPALSAPTPTPKPPSHSSHRRRRRRRRRPMQPGTLPLPNGVTKTTLRAERSPPRHADTRQREKCLPEIYLASPGRSQVNFLHAQSLTAAC